MSTIQAFLREDLKDITGHLSGGLDGLAAAEKQGGALGAVLGPRHHPVQQQRQQQESLQHQLPQLNLHSPET